VSLKVVIIGGAGFIGTATANKLIHEGYRVLVLDTGRRLNRSSFFLRNIDVIEYDFQTPIDAEPFFNDAYAVIHMGCSTIPSSSMHSLAYETLANVAPSVQLFEAASRQGVNRVIFTSSGGTVYGDAVSIPISEKTVLNPISGYGASKVSIESYLQVISHTCGFKGISLRIANPYGPYQLLGSPIGVIARYISQGCAGVDLQVWGDGSVIRDYIYINDLVDAIASVVKSSTIHSGSYNIGTGVGFSINDIINVISLHAEKKISVLYQDSRFFDVKSVVLDITKIYDEIGWRPLIGVNEGIKMLISANKNCI